MKDKFDLAGDSELSVSVFSVIHFSHGSGKRRRVLVSNNIAFGEYMWLALISLLRIHG